MTPQEISRNIHRRAQWFAKGRESPQHSAGILRQRALRQKTAAHELRRNAPSPNVPDNIFAGDWVSIGPAPIVSNASTSRAQDYNFVAGRATAVAIDAADTTGNTVYVGGAYGGVWKSSNAGPATSDPAGVSWVPLTDDQATLSIGSIAIQPQPTTNPDAAKSVILVRTGESNGSVDSYYGLGILRSADAGTSWTLIGTDRNSHPFAGLGFGQIAFSMDFPTQVVAAASTTAQGLIDGSDNPATAMPGIYFSGDGGISWSLAAVNDTAAPTDTASVSSVIYNGGAGKFFAAISLHGIYSSLDGSSWVRLLNQPGALGTACPAHNSSTDCPLYRGQLAAVPGRNEMYVWYVDANDNDGGIWQTLDGGATWSQLDDSGITNCGDLFGGCGTQQGFYNLALAAVPDGMATDLYAGAVNLYKCTISVLSLTCGSQGPFINLTHVYGCSSIAYVHPAQHAIASLINTSSHDELFFANDGGVYRLPDGYAQLSGSCGSTNPFDSLNATLGSMTQLVSISQSTKLQGPNPDVLLAGAQANGSPGTESVESSNLWQNVNAGDGGFTAISPDDDKLWFVSNPPDSVSGVNIFKCGFGASCHTTDFQNNQVVSGTEVGGDAGAFITPFLLDPQDSSQIIVGTCRVWEGPISGGGLAALSYNFETGGDGICSGNETNVVRAIAAGGSTNGLSKVIYAGTAGTGPLATGLPTGGHIWVSTDPSAGPTGWMDHTANINPQHYSISSIAVDNSDPSGLTAYVSIMGFNVNHIWKTTSGGAAWINFDSGVPPAPVNALVLDSANQIIYAGTDVGVFGSPTNMPGWIEVGPPPGSNMPGFLPNVAVTALQIFNPAGARRLRASTYGRGMWELSTFNLGLPMPASVSVSAPGATNPVSLQLTTSLSSVSVNLSCVVQGAALNWAQCNFTGGGPTLMAQVGAGIPYTARLTVTVNANAVQGPFSVAIHAEARGSTQTQNLLVTVLTGSSFTITNTSGPQSVSAGSAASYNLSVDPSLGTFSSAVSFTCSGLPLLATCSFIPSSIAAGASAENIPLTVGTDATTPAGAYTITVTGTPGDGSSRATALLTLTVNPAAADFRLDHSGPATVIAGSSAIYAITVTPAGSTLPNSVTLSQTGCPTAATCTFHPSLIPAGSGITQVSFTVSTTAATPVAPYSITVTGTSGSEAASTTIALAITAPPGGFNFSLSATGPPNIKIGATGLYNVAVTPSVGTFPNPVAITFAGCPAVSTCVLSSSQVAAGSGTTDIVFTIVTTSPALHSAKLQLFALLLPLPGIALLFGGARFKTSWMFRAMPTLFAALLCSGCGGLQGGSAAPAANPGTPIGTYTVTMIGTSGSLTASTTISLIVN